MPKIEIDEEMLVRHQHLAQTVSKLMDNPKARELVEQAVKLEFPNAKTPLLDSKAQQHAVVSGVEKKLDDFIAQQQAERAEREKNDKLAAINKTVEDGMAALKARGWRDAGLKAVREIMDQKGILDPIDAAAIYERDHPPEPLMNPGSSGAWNFLEQQSEEPDKDIEKLIESKGQNEFIADKMAREALQDFRGQLRR